MTSISPPTDLVDEFRLSPEEAFTLAVTKLWLMERDLACDPDEKDRRAKRPVIRDYVAALQGTLEPSSYAASAPPPLAQDLVAMIGAPGWLPALERCLSGLPLQEVRRLLRQRRVVMRLLHEVDSRERAILLTIELASFYPWPRKIKFEKGVRETRLRDAVGAMGLRAENLWEIDGEIRKRSKAMARRKVNWARVGVIAAGGAALGALAGPFAAPYIGTAIGGAMGLSGAAATSAGLALLGGGSLAAGGMGMAGGALVVSGTITATGAGAAAGIGWWREIPEGAVFADSVKLDVTTEYLVLRHESDLPKASELAERTSEAIVSLGHEAEALEASSPTHDPDRARIEQAKSLERKRAYLEALNASILSRIRDYRLRISTFLDRRDVIEHIRAGSPAMMVSVSVAEDVTDKLGRLSYMIPALVVNEAGQPLLIVVVNVLSGKDRTRGRQMMERLGVSHPLVAEMAGLAVEFACNPVVWIAVAGAVAGPGLFQVGGNVAELLLRMQIDPVMLAQAIHALAVTGSSASVDEALRAMGSGVSRFLVPQSEPLALRPA